jgi:hypothetical protein
MCRNRLLFAATHVPGRDRLRWLRFAPRYARKILLSDGREALLRRPSLVAAAAAGTAAGALHVLWSLAADAAGRVRRRPRPSSASDPRRSADRSPAGR